MSVQDIPRNGEVETSQGKTWYINGLISRIGGPAVIIYFKDDYGNLTTNVRFEKYYLNGRLHRVGGPAVLEYEKVNESFIVRKEEYYLENRLHRVGGPARIVKTNIYRNRTTTTYESQEYFENGRLKNGPLTVNLVGGVAMPYAVKIFSGEVEISTGGSTTYTPKFTYESYLNGVRQSVGSAPAIAKDVYGTNVGDRYWYNSSGKIHRSDGPAVIFSSGREEWYSNGKWSRADNNLPSIIEPRSYVGGVQNNKWYLNGKKHRIHNEAVISDSEIMIEERIFKRQFLKEFWTHGVQQQSTTQIVSEDMSRKALATTPTTFTHDSITYTYSPDLSTSNNPVYTVENSSSTLLVGYKQENKVYFTTGLSKSLLTKTYDYNLPDITQASSGLSSLALATTPTTFTHQNIIYTYSPDLSTLNNPVYTVQNSPFRVLIGYRSHSKTYFADIAVLSSTASSGLSSLALATTPTTFTHQNITYTYSSTLSTSNENVYHVQNSPSSFIVGYKQENVVYLQDKPQSRFLSKVYAYDVTVQSEASIQLTTLALATTPTTFTHDSITYTYSPDLSTSNNPVYTVQNSYSKLLVGYKNVNNGKAYFVSVPFSEEEVVGSLKNLALATTPTTFTHENVKYTYSSSLSSIGHPAYIVEDSTNILLVGNSTQNKAYYVSYVRKDLVKKFYTSITTPTTTSTFVEIYLGVMIENLTSEYKINSFPHRTSSAPAVIRPDGTQEWYTNGKLHRGGDLPAVIRPDGTREWYTNGERNRTGNPAVIHPDGTQEWYTNGKLHRGGDLPAIIRPDGTREWYTNGERNRTGNPAVEYPSTTIGAETFTPFEYWVNGVITRGGDLPAVRRVTGDKEWYVNGRLHRLDNPAIIRQDGSEEWYEEGLLNRVGGPAISKPNDPNGYRAYYLRGKLHRTDGPAIIYPDGSEEYYLRKLTDDAPKEPIANVGTGTPSTTPRFLNLSEETTFSKTINIYFQPNVKIKFGLNTFTDIPQVVLSGSSIIRNHCTVENISGVCSITPVSGALLYINGIQKSSPYTLQHNDRVIIGTEHAFLFLSPTGTIDSSIDWNSAYLQFKTLNPTQANHLRRLEPFYQSVLSREDLPAVIRKNSSGVTVLEEYWNGGYKLRADDEPAVVVKDSLGNVVRREWWNIITYTTTFVVMGETGGVQNTKNTSVTLNVLNRSVEPAVIETRNGITREEYWDRGGKNRVGGEAVIESNDEYILLKEYWKSDYDEVKDIVIRSYLERDPNDLSKPVIESFNSETGTLRYKVVKTTTGGFETIYLTP